MQELLGRLAALDPEASLSLRVIACFDELVVGNVNTRGLLSAAASLAGCAAGFRQDSPPLAMRVSPSGEVLRDGEPAQTPPLTDTTEGISVWLEREGERRANDAIIVERLALAVRIRHGRTGRDRDNRRELAVVLDPELPLEARVTAAARLGLAPGGRYRVLAAPLFAVWTVHPNGPEDVVPTPYGSIHAVVLPPTSGTFDATPAGVGTSESVEHLHRSFRTALVALRLCDPPLTPLVDADDYGGLISILADMPADSDLPDVEVLDHIMAHSWGRSTVDALVRAGSVRQAARLADVHHSTLQTRLDAITGQFGFDPFDGLGRARLGIAYLVWRLRHSRVLDLPAPGAVSARIPS